MYHGQLITYKMMKKNIMNTKYIWLLLILLGFTACNDEEDFVDPIVEVEYPALTAGSADFSKFVSLGNSLTAGFTDNALFIAGQENSLPNILSQKFALVGGGSFTQPLANDNIGGLILGGSPVIHPVSGKTLFEPRLVLGSNPLAGPMSLESVIGPVMPTTDFLLNNPTGPFNNLGVPGAKGFHLLAPGYGSIANFPSAANPYAIRITGNTNDAIIDLAIDQNPSFFSLWIGNNDVLGYALSGGESDPMSLGYDPITPTAMFDGAYAQLIASLTGTGAEGVVANIPYVTTIPHFTTVPHNPLEPSNPDFAPQIPTLNTIFGALNGVYAYLEALGQIDDAAERTIIFSSTEASAVVIYDENLDDLSAQIAGVLGANPDFATLIGQFGLPPQAAGAVAGLLGQIYGQSRQATEAELFVLPSSSVIGTVNTGNVLSLMTNYGLSQTLAGQFSVEGVSLPLADKWVLLPSEQQEIKDNTDLFNTTIEAAATQAGLAFVDANTLMQELANGSYSSGDFLPTSSLVTGGVFSLDGVHPTARGYALLANEFMRAIDETYGSNFEESGSFTNIGDYQTNYSPLLQ